MNKSSYLILVIGSLFLLVFIVYILRGFKEQKRSKKFLKRWISWANKINVIPLWQHVYIVLAGLSVSTISYLLLLDSIKPHFSMPKTTAINWYTVHHYPRQQDTFYFITAFSFILIITSSIWSIWIFLKNKK